MSNIIKGLRNLRGYTQKTLAEKIKMNPRTYCTKESNPESFTVGELMLIAKILEVEEGIFFKKELTVSVS